MERYDYSWTNLLDGKTRTFKKETQRNYLEKKYISKKYIFKMVSHKISSKVHEV